MLNERDENDQYDLYDSPFDGQNKGIIPYPIYEVNHMYSKEDLDFTKKENSEEDSDWFIINYTSIGNYKKLDISFHFNKNLNEKKDEEKMQGFKIESNLINNSETKQKNDNTFLPIDQSIKKQKFLAL